MAPLKKIPQRRLGPVLPGRWKKRPGLSPNRFSVTKSGGGEFVARRYAPGTRFGPTLPGRWEDRPGLDPARFSVTQAGDDNFVARRILGPPAPPKARGTSTPSTAQPSSPVDPYAGYPDWAKVYLNSITRQGQEHQSYVTDKVQPWVKGVTEGLSGYADTAMQRYLGQLNPALGAAGAAVSGPQMPNVQSSSGGGMVGDPNAYATQAQGQYGQAMGSTFRDIAAHQAALGAMQPATLSQGIVQSIGQYAAGLPSTYADKRAEQESRIGEFIAEMQDRKAQAAEQTRQWTEGFNADEMERSFRRGLDAAALGLRGQPDTPGGLGSNSPQIPGKILVQRADGGFEYETDPSYTAPGTGGGKTAWNDPGKLAAGGNRGPWKVKPKIKGLTPFQATDGTWWVKAPKGAGTKATKLPNPKSAITFFDKWWSGDPNKEIVSWQQLVNSGERTRQNAANRFFQIIDSYGLTPEQDIAIARRYGFTPEEIKAALRG